jgi:hypothetical protein
MARLPGFGSTLYFENDAGTAWEQIGQVQSIGLPDESTELVDVTHLSSPGGVEEFMSTGIKRVGDLTFTVQYDPGDVAHEALRTQLGETNPRRYLLRIPTATPRYVLLPGKVSTLTGGTIDMGDIVRRDVTIKRTGPADWNYTGATPPLPA